jgi:hypothetical protein
VHDGRKVRTVKQETHSQPGVAQLPPRCSPASGSNTTGGCSTVGLTSPRSSGCSTRIAAIRQLTADSTTSRPCCNEPSMKSAAHNTHSTATRTLTVTRISAHRTGDLSGARCSGGCYEIGRQTCTMTMIARRHPSLFHPGSNIDAAIAAVAFGLSPNDRTYPAVVAAPAWPTNRAISLRSRPASA